MKRLLALLLALMMTFGLTGCSDAELGEALVSGALDVLVDTLEDAAQTSGAEDLPVATTGTAAKPTTAAQTTPQATTAATTQATTKATEAATTAVTTTKATTMASTTAPEEKWPDEAGWYYSAEDVSLYLWTYGYLPGNFITKSDARELGWEGGSVEEYAPGYAIGGDKFGNREGTLPKAKGRQYYECDIDTNGRSSRGARRLVFSNDGLIYYTEDHYESFTLLYGEE